MYRENKALYGSTGVSLDNIGMCCANLIIIGTYVIEKPYLTSSYRRYTRRFRSKLRPSNLPEPWSGSPITRVRCGLSGL